MKKLNITKEQFNHSNYFQKKYGKLEYVSESGRLFKTNKGKVLKFNESEGSFFGIPGVVERHDMIIYKNCHIEPSEFWGNLGELYDEEHPEDTNHEGFDDWCWENSDLIESELEHLASYDDDYEGDDYYAESTKKLISEKLDYVGSTNHTVTLCNDCPFCKKHYEFTIEMDYDDFIDAMWKYKYGKRIQDAFPNLTPDEREQIKTGICSKCWDSV